MKKIFYFLVSISMIILSVSNGYALTAGEIYTIEIDAIGSNGAIVDLSGLTTSAEADSNGKIAFSIAGTPDRTSYNFLVVTVKNPDGTTARRSIAPTPTAGATVNLGISNVTEGQAEALISAMQTAGSDNPIMVAFGMVILRTGSLSSADLARVATASRAAVNGFENELTTNLGVSSAQMTTFKSGIVSRLNEFTSLYKDAVDATTDAAAAQNRGKAAGLLMQIFVHSATDAGFNEDYVELALMAAGDAVDDDSSWSSLPAAFRSAVDAEMGSAMQKLRAEKALKNTQRRLHCSAQAAHRLADTLLQQIHSLLQWRMHSRHLRHSFRMRVVCPLLVIYHLPRALLILQWRAPLVHLLQMLHPQAVR